MTIYLKKSRRDEESSPKLLTAIAIGFPDPEVAELSVYKLRDEEKLAQISQQAQDSQRYARQPSVCWAKELIALPKDTYQKPEGPKKLLGAK